MDNNDAGGGSAETVDNRITRLHQVTTELQAATEEAAVYDAIIDAAVETLGFDWCGIGVPVDGRFEIASASASAPVSEGDRTLRVDEGISGKTLQEGESIIVDNAAENEEADPANESITAGLSVPLDDRGVFQGYSSDAGAFDESDLEVADLLAAHATAALERIERDRELTRKNERLEQFASFVSHDLQNPLNVADLRLELAQSECDSDHLDDVARAIDRMETLTDDLLALVRSGQEVREKETIDLPPFCERCWQTVETSDAALVTDTTRTIRADRNRLRRLFENLFRNAVEHGSTGSDSQTRRNAVEHGSGGVTVRVGDLDGGFFLADDGPGIPEGERDKVFENGYSGDAEGTGLGLAIVAEIVEAHGWEIAVTESRSGGARFEITGVTVE